MGLRVVATVADLTIMNEAEALVEAVIAKPPEDMATTTTTLEATEPTGTVRVILLVVATTIHMEARVMDMEAATDASPLEAMAAPNLDPGTKGDSKRRLSRQVQTLSVRRSFRLFPSLFERGYYG